MANEFPEVITQKGIEEELFFLSEEMDGKKKSHVLMRADKNSVTKVDEPVKFGKELPVYIRLISRYIFTGSLEMG